MNRSAIILLLAAVCCLGQRLSAAEPAKLAFDTYGGYFVSNKFEPKVAESFVAITHQKQFDKVFGVAFVMRDKSHRLPKDAFKSNIVLVATTIHAYCCPNETTGAATSCPRCMTDNDSTEGTHL